MRVSNLASRATTVLERARFPGFSFVVSDGHGGTHLRGMYLQEDALDASALKEQRTRKWLLSPAMTDSEIVQTAFKCVLTSREHDAREFFTYRGERVFSPHYDVEDLVRLCQVGRTDAGGRK